MDNITKYIVLNTAEKIYKSTKKCWEFNEFRTVEMAVVQSGVFFKTPLALVPAALKS